MSSEIKTNSLSPFKYSYTKIEVDDMIGYFVSYWNLAIKKLLINYFCSINLENNISANVSLNNFNINLININNSIIENNNPLKFEEKLLTIKVYFLSSEKEINNDFFQNIKQSYDNKNLNLVLMLIHEVKEDTNILKNCTKIINKIKSKTGINDLTFLPYNIVYFDKLSSAFTPFLEFFTDKFNKEFNFRFEQLTKQFASYENTDNTENTDNKDNTDNSNNTDNTNNADNTNNKDKYYDSYQYLEDLIWYFDLLSLIQKWDVIHNYCEQILFKDVTYLNKECSSLKCRSVSNYDLNNMKLAFKNHQLSSIELQEYLINCYIKSSQCLENYLDIIGLIKAIPNKLKLHINNFKTEYHYIFWMMNYFYNLIDYLNSIKNDSNNIIINEGLVFIYSNCIKFLKLYSYKSKNIFIPDKKILLELINCIKNNNLKNIKEQMNNLINTKKEINDDKLNIFINDCKDYKDKLFTIVNDNTKFLEELLSLLNNLNNINKQYVNFDVSIIHIFDIIYILLFFCKFNEVKDAIIPLLQYKFLKEQKIKYIYEYICLILLLILNFIDKSYDNLQLVFKLLNIKYSFENKILENINCDNKNVIYEIISNYLESFNLDEINYKKDIYFSLDYIFDINFFNKENKILFINKLKNEPQKLNYKITNKSGVILNINQINLVFEEIDINNENTTLDNKKKIIYTIDNNKNYFKKIESYIKEKEEFFEIECKDIFKLNNIYKLVEIQYVLNNSIKAIYHIKEKIKLLFSELNINIKSEIYSSYDSPNIENKNNNFYYNILCMIKLHILNIADISELKNKTLFINFCNSKKENNDSILRIQTELLKNNLKTKIPDIIINDLSIEFPPNSIKNINDINSLEIPFVLENTNYYTNTKNSIILKINIQEKIDNNNKILFSYSSIYNLKFLHLFTIGKRFKILKNNSYLLQTFLSLNIETTKVKVYNSNNTTTNIDSKQAINMILILNDKENDISSKLRNNFMYFSLNNEDNIKYRFCYPEKNIIDEIKEMKDIPYHIIISIDKNKNNNYFELLNEIYINICVKKNKEKKVKLMIKINDNNNWCIVGKNKIIEEFDDKKCEKNIEIALLPLIEGFLQLPEIEFTEYEFNSDLNIGDKKDNNEEIDNEFETIEYGTVIEGEKNVLKIEPPREYNLKINLT